MAGATPVLVVEREKRQLGLAAADTHAAIVVEDFTSEGSIPSSFVLPRMVGIAFAPRSHRSRVPCPAVCAPAFGRLIATSCAVTRHFSLIPNHVRRADLARAERKDTDAVGSAR